MPVNSRLFVTEISNAPCDIIACSTIVSDGLIVMKLVSSMVCDGTIALASVTLKSLARTLIVKVELRSAIVTATCSPCEPFDVPETSTNISPGNVIPLTL